MNIDDRDHAPHTPYTVVVSMKDYDLAPTYTVQSIDTYENISHHESLSEANAAIARYAAADRRRAGK